MTPDYGHPADFGQPYHFGKLELEYDEGHILTHRYQCFVYRFAAGWSAPVYDSLFERTYYVIEPVSNPDAALAYARTWAQTVGEMIPKPNYDHF